MPPPASAQEGRAGSALAAGRRPTPFSQGWTSQPGRFFDDVSLPDGFAYDVVASYRDPIGGGDTFGYNNDFIAFFPLPGRGGDRDGLLWVNHEYVSFPLSLGAGQTLLEGIAAYHLKGFGPRGDLLGICCWRWRRGRRWKQLTIIWTRSFG